MTTTAVDIPQLQDLFGLHPNSPLLSNHISHLSSLASFAQPQLPEIKAYSDAVYLNYYPLGISLLFKPTHGYKPTSGTNLPNIQNEDLLLDGVDIYNIPPQKADPPKTTSSRAAEIAFSTYPSSPIRIRLNDKPDIHSGDLDSPQSVFSVSPATTGKDFVLGLGEPDRKGGGAGPSTGSIGIWCEWSKIGVMVEFGGDEAKGPQAWERGKDAVWRVLTLFPQSEKRE